MESNNSETVIASRTKMLLGRPLKYSLLALHDGETHFSVSVRYDSESTTKDIYLPAERAIELFLKLVDGDVTPCTLEDIICDFL